jgi:CDP-glucose 4,6-dehydratase
VAHGTRPVEVLAVSDARVDPAFWRDKRILLTGHTGFKGTWFAVALVRLGARVTGIALPPATSPDMFTLANVEGQLAASHLVDIRNAEAVARILADTRPDIVFHLAAQSLVRRSYALPAETFGTNVMGTVNLLDALRDVASVRVAVMVTTDKVYANREWQWPYREDDALGGHDPYSASKAASEIAIASYRTSVLAQHGVRIASARAGNVIGGGDWSEDRLLPDAVRAWSRGLALEIRRPDAVRPWQHVLEPISAYMILAQRLWDGAAPSGAYNFGPEPHAAAPVRRVVEIARAAWGHDAAVTWGPGDAGPHETALLALETAKARAVLGVAPRWSLQEAVARSIAWYRRQRAGEDAWGLCEADIAAFEAAP